MPPTDPSPGEPAAGTGGATTGRGGSGSGSGGSLGSGGSGSGGTVGPGGGSGGVGAGSGGSAAGGGGGSGSGGVPGNGSGGADGAGGDAGAGDTVIPPSDAGSGTPPAAPGGASPACAAGAMTPAPDGYQMLMSGGRMRKFLVRAPKSYDGKKPIGLIFAFHGGGANGTSFETRIASIKNAVGDRAIFVYPDGLAAAGGMITWARDHKDDLAFVDAILAWAKDKLCYDTGRVFAMGQSSGAYFSHTVGCHRAGVFRAVASNGGGARDNEFVGCKNEPVAAWISNGAADAPHLPPARKARDQWVKINGCTMANPAKTDPSPCVSYAGCKAGFPVHYCENPGGHDIPGYMPMGLTSFFFGNFDK